MLHGRAGLWGHVSVGLAGALVKWPVTPPPKAEALVARATPPPALPAGTDGRPRLMPPSRQLRLVGVGFRWRPESISESFGSARPTPWRRRGLAAPWKSRRPPRARWPATRGLRLAVLVSALLPWRTLGDGRWPCLTLSLALGAREACVDLRDDHLSFELAEDRPASRTWRVPLGVRVSSACFAQNKSTLAFVQLLQGVD